MIFLPNFAENYCLLCSVLYHDENISATFIVLGLLEGRQLSNASTVVWDRINYYTNVLCRIAASVTVPSTSQETHFTVCSSEPTSRFLKLGHRVEDFRIEVG